MTVTSFSREPGRHPPTALLGAITGSGLAVGVGVGVAVFWERRAAR